MLKDYCNENYSANERRRMVVEAALEIAKASVGAAAGGDSDHKVKIDLQHVSAQIGALADAIQESLKVKD